MAKRKYSMYIPFVMMLNILTACTYSVSVVHTEGVASDVIDETQRADPVISPKLSIPIK